MLRAYFDTQLLLAESKGRVAHGYRVFWMGHKGSMEARYTTNKGRLPESLTEDMRQAYKRCEPFLSTAPSKNEVNDGTTRIIRALLLARGMAAREVDKIDLAEKSESELVELFKRLGARSGAPRSVQRAVEVDKVPGLLQAGWEFVSSLNGEMAILRSPSPASASGEEPRQLYQLF